MLALGSLLVSFVSVVAQPDQGAAPPAEETLVFDVPEECGNAQKFEETLLAEHQLSLSELSPFRLELQPEAVVQAEATGFVLTWEDRHGERRFHDPDCHTLFRTAVVVAASSAQESEESPAAESDREGAVTGGAAVTAGAAPQGDAAVVDDPETKSEAAPKGEKMVTDSAALDAESHDGESAEPPFESEPGGQTDTSPEEAPAPAVESEESEDQGASGSDRKTNLRWEGSLQAGLSWGLAPSTAFLTEIEGAVLFPQFGVAVGLGYAPRTTTLREEDLGLRLESWIFQLQATGRPIERLRIDLGLQAGYLVGRSTGVSNPLGR